MCEPAAIDIRILSQARYVCPVRQAVEALARGLGADEQTCGGLALVVSEALANIIRHGYRGREDRPIWIRVTPREGPGRTDLVIVIEDECEGVDLTCIRSRSGAQLKPGGLGVDIIQRVMDEVCYEHRDAPHGVRLTMRKRLSAPTASAATDDAGPAADPRSTPGPAGT